MYHDDKAYQKSLVLAFGWNEKLREEITALIAKVADRVGIKNAEPVFHSMGAFNSCYKVDSFRSLFRFPILGKSALRYEKSNDEGMIMKYISQNTTIPLPKLIALETCDLGPYMVMSFEEGTLLSDLLKAPSDPSGPVVLNPHIDTTALSAAYRNMAKILIELSQCTFSHIGAVGRDDSKNWIVTKRPVNLNTNEIITRGNYPAKILPQLAFNTANEYFISLAETHLNHLRYQRNDAVNDEADARKKYVARHLFLQIAKNFSTTYNEGPFPLYCDDFRPSNVLVDSNMNVRSVIDWEFCYAAPVEFTRCSPWWLLLRHPDDWQGQDLDDFFRQFLPRHQLFIRVMQEVEDEMIRQGKLSEGQRLSASMAESVTNGHFWFCLAATSSYGFDDIYWRFIDPVYHGAFISLEERIGLLTQQQRDELEPFVMMKTQQAAEGTLDDHWTFNEMFLA